MAYQFTIFPSDPKPTFVTAGIDGSLWAIAANALYWYNGIAWQPFVPCDGGIAGLAVHKLGQMWGIGQADSNIYYFNGIAWALQTLKQGGATGLALGPDGVAWCLDNAAKPQVWRFDGKAWVKFGHGSGTQPQLASIASGGAGANDVFLAALDANGNAWLCTDAKGTWTALPKLAQGTGTFIAAGAGGCVFLIDSAGGYVWRWEAGASAWEQISVAGHFAQVSPQEDGRLWAVDSSNAVYSGTETYPSLNGFRGSDWNNAGTALYAVHYEQAGGYDAIYCSKDGITFETPGCGSLPAVTDSTPYFWFAVPLFIPTLQPGDTEKMLLSPIGSQCLYVCDDISQPPPLNFTPVTPGPDPDPGSAGVWNGFADDAQGNVYVGWYSNGSSDNQAILYKSSAASGYKTWDRLISWEARHIHAVRVNPANGWVYVVVGEPRDSSDAAHSADSAKVMRSKDGGVTWTCLTDTWSTTPVMPDTPEPGAPPIYLGLYFCTIGFIGNRVILGEDTDYKQGRIFYFDDDGRDGSDPLKPLPFTPQATYQTANNGEFFLGAASLGGRLYMASQYLAPTLSLFNVPSTRCVSTVDGVTWRLEQVCASPSQQNASSLGIITQHPDRGGKLVYALSLTDSFVVESGADSGE